MFLVKAKSMRMPVAFAGDFVFVMRPIGGRAAPYKLWKSSRKLLLLCLTRNFRFNIWAEKLAEYWAAEEGDARSWFGAAVGVTSFVF